MDNLTDALRQAFDRVAKVVVENDLRFPLSIRLLDADMRCLVAMEMSLGEESWHGQLKNGDLETRTGISLPWLIVAEDPNGRRVEFPLELAELIH